LKIHESLDRESVIITASNRCQPLRKSEALQMAEWPARGAIVMLEKWAALAELFQLHPTSSGFSGFRMGMIRGESPE
jgi:hypothetical protein